MKIISSIKEMTAHSEELRRKGRTLVFVPTMGFLHKGHLTLMEEGKKQADDLIVSIFVNPAQFGPNEDLDTYPRALERDLELCEKIGAAAVFTPDAGEMYPEGFQTYVELTRLPLHLCGLSRPVFFRGVATVVTKLFNIVRPHKAVFGQKDFQQLTLIRQMVRDLSLNIEIIGVPIVREADGLAMSSRNKYLNESERSDALLLHQSLLKAKEMVASGEKNPARILEQARQILNSCPGIKIDYVSICDIATLDNLGEGERIDRPVLMALAVMLGKTRLIDNMIL
ncbi:pantoate--beta-alanine ligase [Desulfospira joergensenii]|uniref:pantoate--beta-alanine ligase n=1 Tax=Desulfospira joergensenii TaxID=53329 RepID=UPI0003B4D718|nr:pantoate--beta-alanine ligase [Desulfospira joergensenii]